MVTTLHTYNTNPVPVNVVIKTITLHHTPFPIHSPNFQTPQWLKYTPHITICPLYYHGNIQIAYLSFSSFPPPPPVTPPSSSSPSSAFAFPPSPLTYNAQFNAWHDKSIPSFLTFSVCLLMVGSEGVWGSNFQLFRGPQNWVVGHFQAEGVVWPKFLLEVV